MNYGSVAVIGGAVLTYVACAVLVGSWLWAKVREVDAAFAKLATRSQRKWGCVVAGLLWPFSLFVTGFMGMVVVLVLATDGER